MTVLSRLVAKEEDSFGYITYVFECLDTEIIKHTKYIMCTRYPNWNHKAIQLNEIGYLDVTEIRAGVDTWYNGADMIYYNYNGIRFNKFIARPEEKEDTQFICK